MVLNNLRQRIDPILTSLGKTVSKSGISPNSLTAISFLWALFGGVFYALFPAQPYLAAIAILISGLFDILDGAVARVTRKVSKQGSLADSTLDRLSEIFVYAGIIYAGYRVSPVFVLLALGFSLLVSYVRAKSDSLNIKMSGVGIGERAERLVALAVLSILGFVNYGIYLVLLLSVVTFVQRYVFASRALDSARTSGGTFST